MFALTVGSNFGQVNNGTGVYTVFVNIVGGGFRFPLIGFINIADGDHNLPQIGFVNSNMDNFTSLQTGFINTVGGNTTGFQLGFVNTTAGSMRGVQFGFINTVGGDVTGPQLGFVNTTTGSMRGIQFGFVNTAEEFNGLQFGFINYADSIESGIPVGFISIVRDGGYKAVELSVTEISPINTAFKIGVDALYSSINVSYNPGKKGFLESIFLGVGLGSNIPINEAFFFNPELINTTYIFAGNQNYLSFVPNIGYRVENISGLSVIIGPSITWARAKDAESFFNIFKHKINENNGLMLGARLALRIQW
jgi:hypothetical protein